MIRDVATEKVVEKRFFIHSGAFALIENEFDF